MARDTISRVFFSHISRINVVSILITLADRHYARRNYLDLYRRRLSSFRAIIQQIHYVDPIAFRTITYVELLSININVLTHVSYQKILELRYNGTVGTTETRYQN